MVRITAPRVLHVAGFAALHRTLHLTTYAVPNLAVGATRSLLLFWLGVIRCLWSLVTTPLLPRAASNAFDKHFDATERYLRGHSNPHRVRVVANAPGDADSVARRFGLDVRRIAEGKCDLDFDYTAPLYNEHVATIVPAFKPVVPGSPSYRPHHTEAADGCELLLDWAMRRDHEHLVGAKAAAGPAAGLIAIVPGLASDSHSEYIMSFVVQALQSNYDVVVLNSRGMKAAQSPLTRPKAISGAFTDDVRHVVYNVLARDTIRDRCGDDCGPLVLVGFSLGANVLCKFLSEDGDRVAQLSQAVMAAAVSAPWRFHDSFRNMTRRTQMAVYQPSLTAGLVRYLRNNEHALRDAQSGKGLGASDWDWDKAVRVRSVHDFDSAVVVPHHGYDSREHYYADASCFPRLGSVRLPLLCVATADDVICGRPPALHEWRRLIEEENANICYAFMPAGGHLGFLQDPAAEARGDANPAEALVLKAANNFVAGVGAGRRVKRGDTACTAAATTTEG